MSEPEEDPTAFEPESDPIEPGGMKLFVNDQQGTFILSLPEGYRVTFGAVNPGQGQGYDHRLHCLRVWDGPGKSARLRAVFCDVRGIRDLGIPFARKVAKETGSAEWTRDDLGNFDQRTSRKMLEPMVIEDEDAF